MISWRRFLSQLCWLAFGSVASMCAGAMPTPVSFGQVHHAVWTAREGAPPDAWAISRTVDGWMWFGGPGGLVRFDGNAFERIETEPPGSDRSQFVSALMGLASGELVIGYHNGGVAVLRDGHVTSYHEADGFDGATVFDITQDADHQLWVATRTGLHRFDGAHWRRVGIADGMADGPVFNVAADTDGRVWVSTSTRLFHLARGGRIFEAGAALDGPAGLVQSPDGRLWAVTDGAIRLCDIQHAAAPGQPLSRSTVSDVAVFDPRGGLWTLTMADAALVHVDSTDRIAELAPLSGHAPQGFLAVPGVDAIVLATASAKTMLRTRDGALWITTVAGTVEEFTPTAIVPVRSAVGANGTGAVAATSDGAVWLAVRSGAHGRSPGDGLWRLDGPETQVQPQDIPLATDAVVSSDGTLWVAGDGRLWRRTGHGFVADAQVPAATGVTTVSGMVDDPDTHAMWVAIYGGGLFLRHDGAWQRNGGLAALPAHEPATLVRDAAGHLWFGYADGRVIELAHGSVARELSTKGARVGSVRVLSAGRVVLVGGDLGLALLQDGRFRSLTSDDPAAFEGLTGIVEDPAGNVWLNGAAGVVRIAASELDAATRTGSSGVAVRIFDAMDGYPGNGASNQPFGNTMARAADGRIWFAAAVTVGALDPSGIGAAAPALPLELRSLKTAAGPIEARGPVHLQAGTRDVQVDYTSLDFDHPGRDRFRYRLIGLDDQWTGAGARREAIFTNLAPGRYRFEVESRSEISAWQPAPVTLEIDIPPTFLQSGWFVMLCSVAGVLALVLLVRAREQQLRQRERLKLHERVAERERIARELHDTLLQSTQGLALKVQAAARRIEPGASARTMLDDALRDADLLMVEGRDRIQQLRATSAEPESLAAALTALGRKVADERHVDFALAVQGVERVLTSTLFDEAHRIGSEALLNAFHHAHAQRIEVELQYGVDDFRMRVRDDGVGIDERVLRDGHAPGRWGLRGMRERAARVGGALDVWSAAGAGTEVEFRVPAAVAYVVGDANAWHRAWRWVRGRGGRRASRPSSHGGRTPS